jgi:nitroimidazol reductase NimA-like FMN-containing flavoprotein (pyridoxamine 5'-phosphate oxidase superfamily)
MPYIVPVCFGHADGCIYFHCAAEGKKIDIIRENNNVCFEVEVDVELVPGDSACRYTMKFKSVIGFGKAHIVEDPGEKKKGLDIIMEHYSGSSHHEYAEQGFRLATIVRIDIDTMTGKWSKA